MTKIGLIKFSVAAASMSFMASASATEYRFTVTCPQGAHVVRWVTGAIDPGHEALRVLSGTRWPGCSVADHQPADARFPVVTLKGPDAVVQAIPLLGPVVAPLFKRLFGG